MDQLRYGSARCWPKSHGRDTIAASSPTNIIWAPAGGVEPYYTLNGGENWNPVVLPGGASWSGFDWAYYLSVTSVTADRVLTNTFYLFYPGNGLYETTNGGATWTQAYSGDLSPYDYYNTEIQSVPGEAGNLFFTGGFLAGTQPVNEPFMRSTDGGATWTVVPNVLEVGLFWIRCGCAGSELPRDIHGWICKQRLWCLAI
jgi:hypothetical protein